MNSIYINVTTDQGSSNQSIEIPKSLSNLSAWEIKELIIGAIQEVK